MTEHTAEMPQPPANPVYLERREPALNMARFYAVTVNPTLFPGEWVLVRPSLADALTEQARIASRKAGRGSPGARSDFAARQMAPDRPSLECALRSANQGRLRGEGVVRRPHELTPVALCQLDPGPQPLLRVQKPSHAHQEPALDSLTVPAALAVPRGAAELDGLEIGPVDIEQGQRGVGAGPAGQVAGVGPADARTDVVTEAPELGPARDQRAKIVRVRHDRVRIGASYPDHFVQQPSLL